MGEVEIHFRENLQQAGSYVVLEAREINIKGNMYCVRTRLTNTHLLIFGK